MQEEDNFDSNKSGRRLRLKIKTNRNLQFVTSVKYEATVSELANRALSVYLELTEDTGPNACRKQLTVAAVKQGVYYMPKSEYVANLLAPDDQVEVLIVKAKPKYPNQLFQSAQNTKKSRP